MMHMLKLQNTRSLSLPFPITKLPSNTSILRPRISRGVKITDREHFYKTKCCLCTDGSRMIVGVDFDSSYALVIEGDALLLVISLAISKNLTLYLLEISNAFQKNMAHDPNTHHYIHLYSLYIQWFKLRSPNHPLSKQHNPECLFYRSHGSNYTYLTMATDDILLATTDISLFHILYPTFDQSFAYTTLTEYILHFLNCRTTQSTHGTSVDQYSYVRFKLLRYFYSDDTDVHFQSRPFPLDPEFDMELHKSTPLSEEELESHDTRYHCAHNHWTGTLLHISTKSRSDLSYLTIRLSGYDSCPSKASYKALYQGMCYIYHRFITPIMHSSKYNNVIIHMRSHFAKGDTEITNFVYTTHTSLKRWFDTEFCRDVFYRRFTTSTEHTKQPVPEGSVNDAKPDLSFRLPKTRMV